MHLDTVFSGDDVKEQFQDEARLFGQVDKFWGDLMSKVRKDPVVINYVDSGALLQKLQQNSHVLDELKHKLIDSDNSLDKEIEVSLAGEPVCEPTKNLNAFLDYLSGTGVLSAQFADADQVRYIYSHIDQSELNMCVSVDLKGNDNTPVPKQDQLIDETRIIFALADFLKNQSAENGLFDVAQALY